MLRLTIPRLVWLFATSAAERISRLVRDDMLRSSALIVSLLVVSVTLTVGNKWIMHKYSFPMTLLAMQNTVASFVLGVMIASGCATMKPLRKAHILAIGGASLGMVIQLVANMLALPHVSVASLTVVANSRGLVMAFFERLLLGARFTAREYAALALIAVSAAQYSINDATSNVEGILWLFVNLLCYVVIGLYKRFHFSRLTGPAGQSSAAISLIENVLTLPFLVLIVCFSGETGWTVDNDSGALVFAAEKSGLHQMLASSSSTKLMILLTSLFCGCIGALYTALYKTLAATAITVIGNIAKVVAICASVFVFGTILPVTQAATLAVVLIAGTWFAIERKRSQTQLKIIANRAAAESSYGGAAVAVEDAFVPDSNSEGENSV